VRALGHGGPIREAVIRARERIDDTQPIVAATGGGALVRYLAGVVRQRPCYNLRVFEARRGAQGRIAMISRRGFLAVLTGTLSMIDTVSLNRA
jgi:hypothetical protein